jgi:hypothetical protein
MGPFGSLMYTAPDSSSCGGIGYADLAVSIYVDGKLFAVASISTIPDGGTRGSSFDATRYLFEPGSAVAHTATATAFSACESGTFPAPFTVSALRFDIVRAS